MALVRASQRIWLEKSIKCRKAVGNSIKLVLFKATRSTWNKGNSSKKAVILFLKLTSELRAGYRLLSHCSCIWQNTQANILNQLRYSFFWDVT